VNPEDEFWTHLSKYPGHWLSSYGRIKNSDDELLELYVNEDGWPSVHLEVWEWSFDGPVAWLMFWTLFVGNKEQCRVNFHDGDPMNTRLDNLKIEYLDSEGGWQTVSTKKLSSGLLMLDRRVGKRIQIIETGEMFESVQACAEAIGGSATNIWGYFRGVTKSVKGYTFRRL